MIVYKNANRTKQDNVYCSLWAKGDLQVLYEVGKISHPHPLALKKGHGLWVYKTFDAAQEGERADVILVCQVRKDDLMKPCEFLSIYALSLEQILERGGEISISWNNQTLYTRAVKVLDVLPYERS